MYGFGAASMYICYIDDAGCTGVLPSAASDIQPVFALMGLFVQANKIQQMTQGLMSAKRRFFPGLLPRTAASLDWIRAEKKGSDLRAHIAAGSVRQQKAAIGYLDRVLAIADEASARLVGRVLIKGINVPIDGTALYSSYAQKIINEFQMYLESVDDFGIVIADSRNKPKNTAVSHSVFTQKFHHSGDSYHRILEMLLFGHSDNHAGIQIADTQCSAIVVPMGIETYCAGLLTSLHVRDGYDRIKRRYAARIKDMQCRYNDAEGRRRGGVVVSDGLEHRSGALFFDIPPVSSPIPQEAEA